MSAAPSPTRPAARGFAVPGRFHVILLFMTQFILLMAAFGIAVPTWHERGVSTVLLAAGSVAFVVAMQLGLGAVAKLLPIRCRGCGGGARFRGFGWWPFIYRYDCGDCSRETRFEVTG